jgi:hypothetical protein
MSFHAHLLGVLDLLFERFFIGILEHKGFLKLLFDEVGEAFNLEIKILDLLLIVDDRSLELLVLAGKLVNNAFGRLQLALKFADLLVLGLALGLPPVHLALQGLELFDALLGSLEILGQPLHLLELAFEGLNFKPHFLVQALQLLYLFYLFL